MRTSLSISLPDDFCRILDKLVRETRMTRSQLIKLALRDFLFKNEFQSLRSRLVGRARKRAIYTDEDVFRLLS